MPHLGWFDESDDERRSAPEFDAGDVFIGVIAVVIVLLLLSLVFWK
ncbi:MAG: hypothetical protein Q7S64_01445 [bacterium]|nr:hypothetical protein [bacterium]